MEQFSVVDFMNERAAEFETTVKSPVDGACVWSAIFFCVGNFFRLMVFFGAVGDPKPETNYAAWKKLEPEYLKEQWAWRESVFGFETASGILTAMAWLLLVPPLLSFAWVRSRGMKYRVVVHGGIACAAMVGAFFEAIATLMTLGNNTTMGWIAREFDLRWGDLILHTNTTYGGHVSHGYYRPTIDDDLQRSFTGDTVIKSPGLGYKSLELTYLTTQGNRIWIDAIDWLALSVALFLAFRSIQFEELVEERRQRIMARSGQSSSSSSSSSSSAFSLEWAQLGLFVSFVCFLDFIGDCARFVNWGPFQIATAALSLLNTMFLLPAWLLWLAIRLPPAMSTMHKQLTMQEYNDFERSNDGAALLGSGGGRGGRTKPASSSSSPPEPAWLSGPMKGDQERSIELSETSMSDTDNGV